MVSAGDAAQSSGFSRLDSAEKLLAADIRRSPAPTLWARSHRIVALGGSAAKADVQFCLARLRPPTALAPAPHWFDADDDPESVRIDKSESHEGQLTLALVSQLGIQGGVADLSDVNLSELVAAEKSRHLYKTFIDTVNQSAQKLVHELMAAPQEDAVKSPAANPHALKRWTQRQLAEMDLSWFIEAVVLDLVQRRRPLSESWTDADGCVLSVEPLLGAQLKLFELNNQAGEAAFLAEGGVHTAGMLFRVAAAMDWDGKTALNTAHLKATARHWLKEALERVLSKRRLVLQDYVLMAHLLEILNCRAITLHDGPGADFEPGKSRLTNTLIAYVHSVRTDFDFVFATHLLHALRLGRMLPTEGQPQDLSYCASI